MKFGFPAVVALAGALFLGLTDYETTSVLQLFNAENAPFMLMLFTVFFGVAFLLQEAALWVVRQFRGGAKPT